MVGAQDGERKSNVAPALYPTVAEAHRALHGELSPEEKEKAAVKVDSSVETIDEPIASGKVLTLKNIPQPLIKMEYAVRGAIVDRADAIRKAMRENPEKYTRFSELIFANIGNPQAVGQKPITLYRQVLSCLINPSMLQLPESSAGEGEACFPYPEDVRARAKRYLAATPSYGAYSASPGIEYFRELIAQWFENRDGYSCDPDSIFLTDGASPAVKTVLEFLIDGPIDGVMIPVPQYPLYSATITRLNGRAVPYYLDETTGWSLSQAELSRALREARQSGASVKGIAVINPGNPTGSMLKESQMVDIIRFCEKEHLVLIADEVYQNNIYAKDTNFVSFRKVMKRLNSSVELASVHSSSKSVGECGLRGGLMQLENWHPDAVAILKKVVSVALCSNTIGQAITATMLDPPKENEASHALWKKESDDLHGSLARKAEMAYKAFNSMPGMSCQPITGAMYAFPRIYPPPRAIETAKERGVAPDMLYCLEMLEEIGVVCVPGSGFEQEPGTHHFRVTILPLEEKYKVMLSEMQKFHMGFLQRYGADTV